MKPSSPPPCRVIPCRSYRQDTCHLRYDSRSETLGELPLRVLPTYIRVKAGRLFWREEPTSGLEPLTPAHYERAVICCWGLHGVANPAFLGAFLRSGLLRVAPYCVPGGARGVSNVCGLCVADPLALDWRPREEDRLNTPSYASYPMTFSSCPSCALGGIIGNVRSRSQQIAGFFAWPIEPTRRERRTTMATRSARSLS